MVSNSAGHSWLQILCSCVYTDDDDDDDDDDGDDDDDDDDWTCMSLSMDGIGCR